MNKFIGVGRLTKSPEFKLVGQNNTSNATFTIAIDRKFKDAQGNKQTDFLPCVAWGKTAEFVGKYFTKGMRIGVSGEVQTRNYEKNGQKVYVTEILVSEAEFVEGKTQEEKDREAAEQEATQRGAEAMAARIKREKEEAENEDFSDLPFEF